MFMFRKLRGCSDFVVRDGSTMRKTLSAVYGDKIVNVEQVAAALGGKSGCFNVPHVLGLEKNEDELYVSYRKIDKLVILAELQKGNSEFDSHLFACGKSLAIIHDKLCLDPEIIVRSEEWDAISGEQSFLHGDFTTLNVGVANDNLYIWDWIPSRAWGFYANQGPVSIDICSFLFTLFMYGNSFLRSAFFYRKWMKAFFSGYLDGRGKLPERQVLSGGIFRFTKKVCRDLWLSRAYIATIANFCGGVFCVAQVLLLRNYGNKDR